MYANLKKVGPSRGSPMSANNLRSQTASWVAVLGATYSASVVDNATVAYFLLSQLTAPPASENTFPEVENRSSISPAQFASE